MARLVATATFLLTLTVSAQAALDIGERAPEFKAQAALAGKVYDFSLADALKKGPVVLYFFQAAYSVGCSLEAHNFAEASDEFSALGASVVGVSADDIDTLSKFSVQACQNRFPVVSDENETVIKSYDAVMQTRPDYANRISYVIAPDGSIIFHYMNLNPTKHVEKTLGALREWAAKKR
ncbi:MAG TPA: peroxiredoxin [Casimicrobiaceae bacterium]|nr:peroxiredoxin [Casimicrobiaceae bacterium]